MASRLRPRKWVLLDSCSTKCSLNPANLGENHAELVHGWYEAGLNDRKIAENSIKAGFKLSYGAIGRHRSKHLEPKGENNAAKAVKHFTDLEIIDAMIQSGGSRADQFKMTPSETMKAMELKYKLTQGSAFEGMLDALNRAAIEEEDYEPPEDDPSIGKVDDEPETS